MFGKPEWFRLKRKGGGLCPVVWQGWAYTGIWLAVICLPFVALFASRGIPAALIWIAAAMLTLLWDVRQVKKAMRQTGAKELLYIGDDASVSNLSTANYDLQLRE